MPFKTLLTEDLWKLVNIIKVETFLMLQIKLGYKVPEII